MENNEREISLAALFNHVLKRWRSIIIVAVIFAVLFSALGYFKEQKRLNTPIEKIEAALTVDEKNTVRKLQSMDKELKALNYYIENSGLMNMDPYNIQCASVSYFINTNHITNYAGDTESDLIWDIIDTYVSKLNGSDWKKEALEACGSDIDIKYFNEIVSISTSGRSFTVAIRYPDADQLKIIMTVLQDNIEQYKQDIAESIGDHSLSLTNNSMEASILDIDLKDFQTDRLNKLSSLYEEEKTLKSTLNQNQKTLYYGRVLSVQELNSGILSDELPQAGISLKKLIMGGFLGGIIMFVIYSVQFLAHNRVLVNDDISENLGIKNLGYIEMPKKKKPNFIDRIIRKSELHVVYGLNEEEQFNVILSNIKLNSNGINRLYISSFEGDALAERIVESLNSSGIKCQIANSILKYSDSLDSSCGVILILRTEQSEYPQICREISFCKMRNVNMIGAAVEIM